ncbi:two-component system sensor histidine kinase/response regulator [Azorhizobium oxalatiphilum]|uniref:histidine kinase n=1 Tax=Azorhizobium oxalatiphilum TaxID=980631 RepID=A0A917C2U9_9HYPH|nr:histidine kinase dimerization/phosphoacceptor domain -containing protein [Azorhizobium oxalatiphilum]GGF65355.1 two-component system sensor histidine kinase/response regulator [Azorhizobium oxalatiphilum]
MGEAARMEAQGSAVATTASAGVRLLYIDDDPGLGRLVQRQLGRRGYLVELATCGEDGLARIAAGGIDVVALDHYMPGQDGLETLAAIRLLASPPPVVYVTGTQESRVAVAALKAGAADYVVKDVQGDFIELLDSAMAAALQQVKMHRAHEAAEAEIRAARDRFEALAAERALLLREMNHRVGNSLQIIMSLLHLQAGATDNAEVQTALSNARGRVAAVAQVHRRLYTSDQVTTVAVDQYLGPLLADLEMSAQHGEVGISLATDIDPIEIDPDRAVALGVIVTELVINASKYAYPGGKGPVRVHLFSLEGNIELTVEDEGVGIPDSGTPVSSTGLGDRIVRAMASKLGAVMEFPARSKGAAVRLTFPLRPTLNG